MIGEQKINEKVMQIFSGKTYEKICHEVFVQEQKLHAFIKYFSRYFRAIKRKQFKIRHFCGFK